MTFWKFINPKLKLQFEASNLCTFLPVFGIKCWKTDKNVLKLLALNCNISALGWWIFKNSKAEAQRRMGACFEPNYKEMQLQEIFLFNFEANSRCKIHFQSTITVTIKGLLFHSCKRPFGYFTLRCRRLYNAKLAF